MKELLLTTLRDKTTSRDNFRKAAHNLSCLLAYQAAQHLPTSKKHITTPCGTAEGTFLTTHTIVIVPILRSGIAMLPAFLSLFPLARVGFMGLKRDEKTAQPHHYHASLPTISESDTIIIIDPTIATGGSACATLNHLIENGIKQKHIIFANILCATPGKTLIMEKYPDITLITAHEDHTLNNKFFIVPGFGDFGDRYFGTE